MNPAGNYPPAPKKALRATEVVGQKRQARHGDSRIFAQGSRQSESRTRPTRRNQDLLAPVLRQGIPPVPAGTALYARPGSCLARQARGVLAPASELSISNLQAANGFRPAGAFRAAGAFRPAGACAPKPCARPWCFPDGAGAVIIAMNGFSHDAAALCNSR